MNILPELDEIYAQLAERVGGRHVKGGILRVSKVVAPSGSWTMTLDTHGSGDSLWNPIHTRMRAPYLDLDKFRFAINSKNILSRIGLALGMQDINIGDARFDDRFIIQGEDEMKVRRFFQDDRLKSLLFAQTNFTFWIRDDDGWGGTTLPRGVCELCFQRHGVVKDMPDLRGIFDLFACSLQRLNLLGSAQDGNPGISL